MASGDHLGTIRKYVMPSVAFTPVWLRTLKPSAERVEFTDANCPNLQLRVSKSGTKTFVVRGKRNADGTRHRRLVGRFPDVSLAEARRIAQEQSEALSETAATVEELFEECVAAMRQEGKRSAAEYERALLKAEASAVALFGRATPAREVTPELVTEYLHGVLQRSGGSTMDHHRLYLSAAFSRGLKADNDPTRAAVTRKYRLRDNPVTAVGNAGTIGKARDRVLSFDELAALWRRIPQVSEPHTWLAFRLIIAMGGLRIQEIIHSRVDQWELESDQPLFTMPTSKNRLPNVLPLPEPAIELVRTLRNMTCRSPLFPSNRDAETPRGHQWLDHAARHTHRRSE